MAIERKSVAELVRLSFLAAILLFNYSIVRAAIDSTFLEGVGKEGLPWAWLGVALGAMLATSAFDFLARRLSLPRMFVLFSLLTAVLLTVLVGWWKASHSSESLYALYVWKDVHIVVLLEILWGRANSTIPRKTARWSYGLFCAAGSLGGIAGGALTALWAQKLGTDVVLLLALGNLSLVAVIGGWLYRSVQGPLAEGKLGRAKPTGGLTILRESKMLPLLLAMVLLAQVTITLIDYLYNGYMQEAFTDRDQRTAMMGAVNAGIDASAFVLQLLSGVILVSLGVGRTLVLVPLLLGLGVGFGALTPIFFVMGGIKVASKAMDYSIFRAAKEILYIPLSYPEQSQGKGLVDVMSYRTAKAGAAAIVLLMTGVNAMVWSATLAAIALWTIVATAAARSHKRQVADSAQDSAG